MKSIKTDKSVIEGVLNDVLEWSRAQSWRGYNKHDGLNNPVLAFCLGWAKWPRMIAIQGVMRFPVNIRPLLLGRKTYNPKGISLFARSLFGLYRITGKECHKDEALGLLTLLESIESKGEWSGSCWGYHYPWQDPGFFAPSGMPNAVVSSFVCEAFLEGFRVTGRRHFLTKVKSCIDFFLNDLNVQKNTNEELCLGYMPVPMTMRVMDVSILIAAVIAQYSELSGDGEYDIIAKRLATYVVNQQTNYGAWWYTDPPSDSHIKHDNYHTGFILDALMRYMSATKDYGWMSEYNSGLRFYAENLFGECGEPKWMSDKLFPLDIHGAAQGIITFSRCRDRHPDLANQVLNWTLENLYGGQGRFFYQKTRFFVKRFTLLRWCNAWMAVALTESLLHFSSAENEKNNIST